MVVRLKYGNVHFFCFRPEIPFLRKFRSVKNKIVGLLCYSMDWFLYDNGLRHERVKLNLALRLIWTGRIQWTEFILSVLDWKYPFWANLVPKVKISSLGWNSVQGIIIRIWRIWWRCSCFFLFETGKTLIKVNLVQNFKIISLSC